MENSLAAKKTPDLNVLSEWIPERMDPGTVFTLGRCITIEEATYIAALSCPRCGLIGLITGAQLFGGEFMICGGECSAEYRMEDECFVFRKPQ